MDYERPHPEDAMEEEWIRQWKKWNEAMKDEVRKMIKEAETRLCLKYKVNKKDQRFYFYNIIN